MILLIDNYDSFTWNLMHLAAAGGAEIRVMRNDALDVAQAMAMRPQAIILSPGPGWPDGAGICLDLIEAAAQSGLPVLGVCLGHQAIGQAFGAKIGRAGQIMHGKVDRIDHDGRGILSGIASPLTATRYHSLCVLPDSLPQILEVTATAPDGTIMGLRHRDLPASRSPAGTRRRGPQH